MTNQKLIADIDLSKIKQQAASKRKEHEKIVSKLKSKTPKQLDQTIHQKHEQLFENIDCLDCANCCKTTSPLILQSDISNISAYLKIQPGELMKQHIIMDEDGDFVFNQTPCPFLGNDNYCSIYEARPKACREYPHTQQRKQISIIDITLENVAICPAVFRIFEHIESKFENGAI
ncbi:MAG: YkgJ family cysteine cluster protein [Chitinophagales bacterium]